MAFSAWVPRVGGIELKLEQGARLDLVGQLGGFLAGKVTRDGALAVGDGLVDRGVRDHHVIHPDGDGAAHQLAGGLGKLFGPRLRELQADNVLILARGLVLGHGRSGADHIRALQDDVFRRGARGGAVDNAAVLGVLHGLIFHPLAEGELGGGRQLVDGLLGVEILLVAAPGEPDDDPVVGGVGVDLVVGNAVGHHSGLDDLLGRVKLFGGGLHPVRRAEGGLYAAPDINAPTDITGAFYVGDLKVPVLAVHAEQRREHQGEDEKRHYKKHRLFYSLHGFLSSSRGRPCAKGCPRIFMTFAARGAKGPFTQSRAAPGRALPCPGRSKRPGHREAPGQARLSPPCYPA